MKKLTQALSLVLCLILCAFAFASCGKKKPATTTANGCAHEWGEYVVEVNATCSSVGMKVRYCKKCQAPDPETAEIPKLAHTESTDYKTIRKETCSDEGYKTKYCTICGANIDSTGEVIPADPDKHVVTLWTNTANMFNPDGKLIGTCTACGKPVEKTSKYELIMETFTSSSGQYNAERVDFADIRGDKHFYPTTEDSQGNDLYIEFSIFWNDSLLNLDPAADSYICGRLTDGKPIYYFSPVAGCPTSAAHVAGAFEWMGNFKTPISDDEVATPVTMMTETISTNYADFPNIMGDDEAHPEYGWHRVGIRYHLELIDGKDGSKLTDYVGTATCYVDGVAIFKLSTGTLGMQTWGGQLFTVENGEYKDADNYVIPLQFNRARTMANTTAYLAYADVFVSCGKGFVMPVERVANPAVTEYLTFDDNGTPDDTSDDVTYPAPVYFKLAGN